MPPAVTPAGPSVPRSPSGIKRLPSLGQKTPSPGNSVLQDGQMTARGREPVGNPVPAGGDSARPSSKPSGSGGGDLRSMKNPKPARASASAPTMTTNIVLRVLAVSWANDRL